MINMRRALNLVLSIFKKLDPVLLACSLLLSAMSIVTLYGGRDAFGTRTVLMQLAMTLVGLVFALIIANIEYQFLTEKLWPLFALASLAFLASVLVWGEEVGTNKSWVELPIVGILIQPSEFVKASFILTFSYHLHRVKDTINKPLTLLGLAAHALTIVGLILISGDLGVALVYAGIILVMLFCAGLSPLYYAGGLFAVIIAFPYIWPHLEKYQQDRIVVGFNPELDPLDKGYQPLLSRSAIENGGFFGQGINGGEIYQVLPVSESDFVFSTFCEKFGFVGAFLMIAVMVIMVVRLLFIAKDAAKDYGSFICIGIAAMVVIQATENIGMCLAMLPVIGITLPFMSAGGSSILAINITVALAHSVYAHRNKKHYTYNVGEKLHRVEDI